jgi:hypothetical protein
MRPNTAVAARSRIEAPEGCRKSLFALGVMLLELCFGQRLEDQPIRGRYLGPDGVPNAYTDLCTAKEWHQEVYAECGDSMADIIRRCLDCSFGPKPDWSSESFQEAVYRDVVQPLEEFLGYWQGKP